MKKMTVFRHFAVLILVLLVAVPGAWAQTGSASPALDAARRPAPVGYPVLPGIWRLHGNDPLLPMDEDLEPLRRLVGKAPFVALGESIHTSGGYYRMKHRVFRFLVEEMGFRAFAIESNWTGADRVSEYVQTCSGPPEEALRGLFGVWQSAETRDLVQWMCDWNRTHPKPKDRLHFFGFDVQQPEQDGPALLAYLERIGVPGDDPWFAGVQARDEGMAYALLALRALRFPKAKVMVWAHNSHIAKGALLTGELPMGSHLATALGSSYVNFALAAFQTEIDWPGVGCGTALRPGEGSVEEPLHALGEEALLVDLRFPGTSEPYLPHGTYSIGTRDVVPHDLYNGILYLEHSPRMTPLLWRSCRE